MPALPLPDPPLIDGVVRLRPWREADVPVATAAIQDPLVARFTRVPENQTEQQTWDFFASHDRARRAGEELTLAIADAETDEFLGTIGLLRFDWGERRGEVGYWIAREARGRGVATRAVRLIAPWALRELGLGRLALHADPENTASQAVAERSGFTREGILRAFEERKSERHDVVVFSLLPGDLWPTAPSPPAG
jgi:RimJ/RimL family protein N-acetyltransferase